MPQRLTLTVTSVQIFRLFKHCSRLLSILTLLTFQSSKWSVSPLPTFTNHHTETLSLVASLRDYGWWVVGCGWGPPYTVWPSPTQDFFQQYWQ